MIDDFAPDDFFVLRSPLLPIEALSWTREELLARADVQEALLRASPSLHASLSVLASQPGSERARKVERALVRYWIRMSTRPTPLELLAGISLGRVARGVDLTLSAREAWQHKLRVDFDALDERIASSFGERVRPSSGLYSVAGQLRLLTPRRSERGRSYQLVSIEPDEALLQVLDLAQRGASTKALSDALRSMDEEISADDAREFIDELRSAGVLVSTETPPLTTLGAPRELDAPLPALTPPPTTLGAARELDAPLPVHADLIKPSPSLELSLSLAREALHALELLHRLNAIHRAAALSSFRSAFVERYGEAEVPICEALDDELGVGWSVFPSRAGLPELLDGLPSHAPAAARAEAALPESLLREIAAAGNSHELVLSENQLPKREGPLELPDAFAVRLTLAAPDVSGGECLLFLHDGALGPSGARAFGRFCRAVPELEARVRAHLRKEEALAPDVVFAEITHLPAPAGGDVVARPVLREFEIPHAGTSGAPLEKQIHPDDLLVSVVDGAIRLRSKKLGREVRPRITSAHDFVRHGVPLYTFLGLLQEEGLDSHVRFPWGELAKARHVPRLRCEKVVLSRERWRLPATALRSASPATLGKTVKAWREADQLPRWVCLEEPQGELVLDLENAHHTRLLQEAARKSDDLVLYELFPSLSEQPVQNAEGHFVHEVLLPFVRRAARPVSTHIQETAQVSSGAHSSTSPWLYLKLYSGPVQADVVLIEHLAALAERFPIWFFVRYADPFPHLRVRFKGNPLEWDRVRSFTRGLRDVGLLWRVTEDLYEPEVERYGGETGMELAEQLFALGSNAARSALAKPEARAPNARFWLALARADAVFQALDLSLAQRHSLSQRARQHLGKELGATEAHEAALSTRFRALRPELTALLARTHPDGALQAWGARMRAATLSRPLEEVALDLVHMEANRLLLTNPRPQELVLHDFLERLYSSELGRARASALAPERER